MPQPTKRESTGPGTDVLVLPMLLEASAMGHTTLLIPEE